MYSLPTVGALLRHLRIKTKLQLAFLVFGLFIVVSTGWQAFNSGRSALEELSFHRLTSLREAKKSQIEFYFDQLHDQAATISENMLIHNIFVDVTQTFNEASRYGVPPVSEEDIQRLQRYYYGTIYRNCVSDTAAVWRALTANPFAVSMHNARFVDTENIFYSGDSAAISGGRIPRNFAYREADRVLREYSVRFGYRNIYLVDSRSGNVVYSVYSNPVFAASLDSEPFVSTNLARAFRIARDSLRSPYSALTDYSYSEIAPQSPAAYIATPLSNHQKNEGVLVIELGVDEVNAIMTSSAEWEARGMGQSGESYIVGSDMLMRSDSRFLIDNPKRYFYYLEQAPLSGDTVRLIDSLNTTILLQPVATSSSIKALSGQTNTTIIVDYRGERVLSSYSPLMVQGVSWAIIAEIDNKEAFASVYRLQESLILSALIILLIAAVAGYILSKSISRPISQLVSATENIGKGNLAWRVHTKTYDEIGDLARTFNVMADNLKAMTDRLQNEVAERMKAESNLQESHERLRNLSAHLQTIGEEERKSFAREIHDELGQALTALKMETGMLEKRFAGTDDAMKERLAQMNHLISDTIKSVKRITAELRPGILDDLGLSAAIEWQAEEFTKHTGIACTVVCSPQEIVLAQDVSIVAFRLFQETLTNVARHAGAQSVHASLEEEEGMLQLLVSDDGIGISSGHLEQPTSFGILGMRERVFSLGGSLEITGEHGKGTTVKAILPIQLQKYES